MIMEKLDIEKELAREEIRKLIYCIRGKQVMLDSDVARLYHYETKNVNKAMKRNIDRFPEDFCFQLTGEELKSLRFQIGTLKNDQDNERVFGSQIVNLENNGRGQHRKYLPYAYTEQGVSMLAGILKNDIAVKVSISIIRAFIEMRKFISANSQIFERLTNVEYKLLEHDKKFDLVFNELQHEENIKQKIFFEGQIYDAYNLLVKIIRKANQKILLIDNYIDDTILELLTKKNKGVEVIILTSNHAKIQKLDIQKFNQEYPILKIIRTNQFHDRFIVIDDKELYHCGASLKDLGRKCFGINKIEDFEYVEKLGKIILNI